MEAAEKPFLFHPKGQLAGAWGISWESPDGRTTGNSLGDGRTRPFSLELRRPMWQPRTPGGYLS